ncbi:reverse transcriptase domain-containing protein [Tanacetum coccineum]
MNATSSKTDERLDKLADQLLTLVEIVSKKVVTPAPVKAVEETCVTCGGAHSWYNCPATDNNLASVSATTGTYNQVNPPNRVSNQMAPPGFVLVQNNGQNRFNQNQVQGNNFRGNNFHGNQGFQAQNNHDPNFQNQGFQNQPFQVRNNQVQQEISNDFSNYKRNNDQMLRNMQNQIYSLKGDLKNEIQNTIKSQQAVMMNQQTTFQNNLQNMIYGLFQNQASTSGNLLSNTIPNPKGEMKAITTRSDKEQTNFQGSTAQIPPPVILISIPEPDVPKSLPKTTPIPESDILKILPKSNIPYPSRRDDQKSRDKASNQMEKIFQIFQDLRFDISFADALLLMPRFAPTIKSLLMNKKKLLELAKIPLNDNCSAMLLKRFSKSLEIQTSFLFHLSLPDLTPTRMTLELADRSITRPKGVAEYIFIKVGNFHFPTDFVVVDFEADPRVPLILGRSFLRTSHAFIDVYEGELVLRDRYEQITFHVNGTSKHPQKHINESIKMVNDTCKDSFKRFIDEPALVYSPLPEDVNDEKEKQEVKNLAEPTAKRQNLLLVLRKLSQSQENLRIHPGDDIEFLLHHDPSTPMKSVAFILKGFIDDPLFKENDDLFDLECKMNDWKRILYNAPIDEAECFDPGGDNDEIDAFLAIEVPTYIEEGYYDSDGDVLYLKSLLNDDNTHNFSSEVFFDHEPQQIRNEPENESLIKFSPNSDPLHHEFTGELITIPPGIVREHEDYINRMSLLCGNSSSRSSKNSHTIIESLTSSTTLIEESDSNREDIDIFFGPNDSIPPGIESDFDSEEDIIDNLLNDDPIPEYERLTFDMEPDVPVINNVNELNEDEYFDPGGGEINVEVDNSFTFVTQTFLPCLTYPEVSPLLSSPKNEDTIFDPGIST